MDPVKRYSGIYRAIVKDAKDPKNLRRIKVSVIQTTGVEVSEWAWPIISTKRPPKVGSGVFIFYIGGDPEYPVWIGEFGKPETIQGVFAYGSWFSTVDQTASATNTAYNFTVNNTDYSEGIKVLSGSRFTVAESGTYNLQFSAQVHHRTGGGGGAGDSIWIWLKKNGTSVANSATRLNISSGKYATPAWNFYVKLKPNDYVQLAWATDTVNMAIEYESASSPKPAVPSLIVTMNQVA